MNRRASVFFICLLCLTWTAVEAAGASLKTLQTPELILQYDPAVERTAREIIDIYPGVASELERVLGFRFTARPRIVLIKESRDFQTIAGNPLFIAFARPADHVIVMDHLKTLRHPFSLNTTLKHECCHLLLNGNIARDRLPRWLDEGVCQWISDGAAEIRMPDNERLLNNAALSNRLIPFYRLERRFPDDDNALVLAYQQSKSLVKYIRETYGARGLIRLLHRLGDGDDLTAALRKSLSADMNDLEAAWRDKLQTRRTWAYFIALHIYEIVFFMGALATIFAAVRYLIRKKNLPDDPDEDIS